MADTGPIFSILPTSSSRALEKIAVRRDCLALAAQRNSASPVRRSAARTAARGSQSMENSVSCLICSHGKRTQISKEGGYGPENTAVPASARSLQAVIARIQPHSPRAIRISVLLRSSIAVRSFLFRCFGTFCLPVRSSCFCFLYTVMPFLS